MKQIPYAQFRNAYQVPPEYRALCQAGSQLLSAAPFVAQAEENVRCVVDVARIRDSGDNSPVKEPWNASGCCPLQPPSQMGELVR